MLQWRSPRLYIRCICNQSSVELEHTLATFAGNEYIYHSIPRAHRGLVVCRRRLERLQVLRIQWSGFLALPSSVMLRHQTLNTDPPSTHQVHLKPGPPGLSFDPTWLAGRQWVPRTSNISLSTTFPRELDLETKISFKKNF